MVIYSAIFTCIVKMQTWCDTSRNSLVFVTNGRPPRMRDGDDHIAGPCEQNLKKDTIG